MSSALPSSHDLAVAFHDSRSTIIELVLFGMAMVSLGIWIGTEFAWRASFAMTRHELGGVPDVALFSTVLLLLVMGLVDWINNE